MNNSVFGKTMENLRERSNVKLVTSEKRFLKLTAKPTFVSSKIFDENLVRVNMKRERIKLDKPSFTSTNLMYDFHYNYIRKKYTDCQLLFTDTDLLFYHIKTEDIYEESRIL